MVIRSEAARSRSTSRSGMPIGYELGAFCWVGLAISGSVGARAFDASLFGWHGGERRTWLWRPVLGLNPGTSGVDPGQLALIGR